MAAIMSAATPLQPAVRSEPDPIGDGALRRIIREVVREVWKPPLAVLNAQLIEIDRCILALFCWRSHSRTERIVASAS
jgi:hypothetical protein